MDKATTTELISTLLGSRDRNKDEKVVVEASVAREIASTDGGPSLLDLMMAAQSAAQMESLEIEVAIKKPQDKRFGNGFKKGFLGKSRTGRLLSSQTDKLMKTPTPTSGNQPHDTGDIITLTASSGARAPILCEVQQTMADDQCKVLHQLKSSEWANDSLLTRLQGSLVLSAGMRDPRCLAALEAMQADPLQARARFADDSTVSLFLREFARVMSEHFAALHDKQQQEAQSQALATQKTASLALPVPDSLGPLHADVLKRHTLQSGTTSTTESFRSSSNISGQSQSDMISCAYHNTI